MKWFKEVYLPETKPTDLTEWRLLIINPHLSYKLEELAYLAFKNKV